MKIKGISELFSAVMIGIFFGLHSNGLHQKWHRLGREAFLVHESQNFDMSYANPSSLMHLVVIWAVFALLLFVLYKGISFVLTKVLSAFSHKDETAKV
jgi:hypothetical protein